MAKSQSGPFRSLDGVQWLTHAGSVLPEVRVRGPRLPGGVPIDFVTREGSWSRGTNRAVDALVEGWVLPGLVDMHVHPGAEERGQSWDENSIRTALDRLLDAGIVAIRCAGLPEDPPVWFGHEATGPRVLHAGPWLARPGQFIDGWGRRVNDDDFPEVAAKQAASTGWCKIIADWHRDDEPLPLSVLRRVVQSVHLIGGKVMAHAQHEVGAENAIRAGVDSLEHGMSLNLGLLQEMRTRGAILVPTLSTILNSLAKARKKASFTRRDEYIANAERHPGLVAEAFRTGVRVFAGTDSKTLGIVDEIQAFVSCGIPSEAAIGAASWAPREYLGLSGLVPGGLADAVVYDADPRADLDVLRHPRCVIVRGRIVRRA